MIFLWGISHSLNRGRICNIVSFLGVTPFFWLFIGPEEILQNTLELTTYNLPSLFENNVICFCRVPVCTNCMMRTDQNSSLLPSISIFISNYKNFMQVLLTISAFVSWYMEHHCKHGMAGWVLTTNLNIMSWSASGRKREGESI